MSNHYTVHNDAVIDEFVQNHIDQIVYALKQLMDTNLVAVILTGGFGRGEGSILIESPNKMHVVNDYDIELVYRERWGRFLSKLIIHLRYGKRLTKLAGELADRLDVKQLDLGLRGATGYQSGDPPRLSDFDLKYGHKLLYGERNPVTLMTDYKPGNIPIFEGTWLLRNRAIGLLLARFYLQDGKLREDKAEYFYIEINKAILAMGDALFIAAGAYHNSYAIRATRFPSVLPENTSFAETLANLYPLASKYKLKPVSNMYPDIPPGDLWRDVTQVYNAFLAYYESQRLNKHFMSIKEYAEWVATQPTLNYQQRIRIVFDRLRGVIDDSAVDMVYLKQDRLRSIAFAFSLLAACGDNVVDQTAYLAIANRMAGSSLAGTGDEPNWEELARAFLLLIHPKGEVGRAMNAPSLLYDHV